MFKFLRKVKWKRKSQDNVKYIKSISIFGTTDLPIIKDEMKNGNIIVLNLKKFMEKNNGRLNIELRHLIEELTYFSKMNHAEIAQLGRNYLLVTPGPEIQFYKD